MAGLLCVWLEDTIATHLHLASGWLRKKSEDARLGIQAEPDSSWDGLYEDNGSSVDIIVDDERGKRRNVQIINTNPLTLSDGQCFITAQIAKQCRKGLHALPSANLHSILAIRELTIRYTSYGPPRHKLKFIVNAFELQGGTRIGLFGHPCSLLESEQIRGLLNKLQGLRSPGNIDGHSKILGNDMASQPLTQEDDEVGNMTLDSQAAFGTQAVRTIPRSRQREEDAQCLGIKPTGPVLAGNTRVADLQAEDMPVLPVNGAQSTKMQQLLGLLHSSKQSISVQNPSLAVPSAQSSRGSGASKTHREASEAFEHGHAANSTRAGSKSEESKGASRAQATPPESPPTTTPSAADVISQRSEHNDFPSQDIEWMKDYAFDYNSVTIHYKQETLLARPESWSKPEPGSRFPDGNIPIEIQIELSERRVVEVEEEMEINIPEDDKGLHLGPAEHHSEPHSETNPTEDEEDMEIPWSSSPIAPSPPPESHEDALPPDSSIPSAEQIIEPRDEVTRPISACSAVQEAEWDSHRSERRPLSPDVHSMHEDSDVDMEITVPQALGDDESVLRKGSPGLAAELPAAFRSSNPPTAMIQVQETPYSKEKNANTYEAMTAPSSTKMVTSSGTSKGTGSTPIIYGTYSEPRSSSTKSTSHHNTEVDTHALIPDQVMSPAQDVGRDSTTGVLIVETPEPQAVDEKASPIQGRQQAYDEELPNMDLCRKGSPTPPLVARISCNTPIRNKYEARSPVPTAPIARNLASTTVPQSKRRPDISPRKIDPRKSKKSRIKVRDLSDLPALSQDPHASYQRARDAFIQRKRNRHTCNDSAKKSPVGTSVEQEGPASDMDIDLDQDAEEWERSMETNVALTIEKESQGAMVQLEQTHTPQPSTPCGDSPHSATNLDLEIDIDEQSECSEEGIQAPSQLQQLQPEMQPATVYERFRLYYPEYSADRAHFLSLCQQIKDLDGQDKMVPRFMWDDYIIRNRTDFKAYAVQCIQNGDDPKPYHRFYKDAVNAPKHTKGVVKDIMTLQNVIRELSSSPAGIVIEQKDSHTRNHAVLDQESVLEASPRLAYTSSKRPRYSLPVMSQRDPLPNYKGNDRKKVSRQSLQLPSTRSSVGTTRPKGANSNSREPEQSPGKSFRDFVKGQQKIGSLNGQSKVELKTKTWPDNIAVRTTSVPPSKIDVLLWSDTL